jgi:hypothetical protein
MVSSYSYYYTIIHCYTRSHVTRSLTRDHPLSDQAAQLVPRAVHQRHHQPVESYGTRDV